MDQSDLIVEFCGITSADPAKAESYLKVSEYDLERAVGLYFETGGADLSGPPPAGPPPEPPQPALHQTPPAGPIIIEDEDEEELFPSGRGPPAAQNTVDEDEALARQLMQEEVEQQEIHGDSSSDGVRSPIAARSDVLVHPDTDYDTHQYRYGSRRPGRGSHARGIFNQGRPSIWNEDNISQSLADATGGSSQMNEKSNRLAQLYRRPFEIMHNATLEEARDRVREEEPMKWIMVNIMNSSEFACQILNRDLWSDRNVQKTLRENFYFLQFTADEPEGLRYKRTYPYSNDPHIGIIDPRTGEQVKTWNQVIGPQEFIMEIHDFLGAYSLSEEANNPIGRKNKIRKTYDMMTEEEQMEAALAASLGQEPQAASPSPPAMPEPQLPATPLSQPPPAAQPPAPPRSAPSASITKESEENPSSPSVSTTTNKSHTLFSTIKPFDIPEPPQSPQTTRIQFRFPGGGRPLVRRFNKSDTIRDVFAFVKGLRGDDEEEFELVFVGRRLLAEAEASSEGGHALDKSIMEAGLANGSLTVEV